MSWYQCSYMGRPRAVLKLQNGLDMRSITLRRAGRRSLSMAREGTLSGFESGLSLMDSGAASRSERRFTACLVLPPCRDRHLVRVQSRNPLRNWPRYRNRFLPQARCRWSPTSPGGDARSPFHMAGWVGAKLHPERCLPGRARPDCVEPFRRRACCRTTVRAHPGEAKG